jgi:dolichol kinase
MPTPSLSRSRRWLPPPPLLLLLLPLLLTSSSLFVVVGAHSPLLPSRRQRHQRPWLHWKSTSSQLLSRRNYSSLLLRAGDIGSGNNNGEGGGTKAQRDTDAGAAAPIPPSPFPNNNNNINFDRQQQQQQQHHEESATNSVKADDTTTTAEEEDAHVVISKKLKNRNATNLSRKLTHAGFGIFFACLNQFIPKHKFLPSMAILTSSTLLMELLRYRRGFHWMNVTLHYILGGALRKHEMEGMFTGSFYYFAGVTASAYLFPKTAGTMGICQLALADPSASYFGRRTRHIYWSRIENGLGGLGRNKGILGFVGGALFCFPFNYRVFKIAKWGVRGVPGGEMAVICASLLLGFAGAFADLAVPTPALTMPKKVLGIPVPPFHLDDNFVVPIFSGWACTKIFALMGWDDGLELAEHIIF